MPYEVTAKELEPEKLAAVRGVFQVGEIGQAMAGAFGRIMAALSAQGIYPAGPPVAVYHSWTDTSVDTEIAFPVSGDFVEREGVMASELPGERALSTVYVGPYDQMHAAYEVIKQYAGENGLELGKVMWERYFTDPHLEPDLSKHVTHIYWPLA
jgi:effector-binding domain-containing protein